MRNDERKRLELRVVSEEARENKNKHVVFDLSGGDVAGAPSGAFTADQVRDGQHGCGGIM